MAASLIPNKYLCYKTEEAFLKELQGGSIMKESIVFILDKRYIYSQGKYFYCDFSPEVQKTIASALSELSRYMDEGYETIAAALAILNSEKLGRDELDVESIKADIRRQGAETSAAANLAIAEAVEKLESQLNNAGIAENARVTSASLGELWELQNDGFLGMAAAINELKSQVRELQEQINKLKTND